jgi:aryl-alcohol dehydrogenase-like predicted oxidoreductase
MQYVNLGNSGLKVSKIGFGKIINPTAEAYE